MFVLEFSTIGTHQNLLVDGTFQPYVQPQLHLHCDRPIILLNLGDQ